MELLLTHGYFLAEDAHERRIMKPYPPLGLLYISSYLKSRSMEVAIFDSTFQTMNLFADFLRRTRPELVGIYCNLMTKFNVLEMIRLSHDVGAKVILGGPEPANYAEEYLRWGVDVIVVGEGEHTTEALVRSWRSCRWDDLASIAGIVFTGSNGQIVRNPSREPIGDLSVLPWPDRESIDLDRYLTTWKTHHGFSSLSVITSRGCPYTCTWCSHSVFGQSHRRRSVGDVADELEYLTDKYHPDRLWYADDVMTINPKWFKAYSEEIQKRRLFVPYECISRADRLDEDIVKHLGESGCYQLWIGSESGSQKILDAMQRRTSARDVQSKTWLLQKHGIRVGMFIMLGYDGETLSDIEETVAHLKAARPDVYLTTVSYPIKGTPYFLSAQSRIESDLPWHLRTDRDWVVRGRPGRLFYRLAERWMASEVALHRRETGRSMWTLWRKWLTARIIRWVLHKMETSGNLKSTGRAWSWKDRAQKAW